MSARPIVLTPMSEKLAKRSVRSSRENRRAIAERINAAFETGDIAEICRAIEVATRQHNVADLARRAGIERTSLYRAFAGGEKHPNYSFERIARNGPTAPRDDALERSTD